MPDPDTRVELEFGPDDPGERFVLGDITETDGTPWACCLRTLLRNALADAREARPGSALRASFEHEFHYATAGPHGGGGFGLRSFRAAADFAERFAGALDQAGIAVELIQPEYGISQLEISIAPRPGLEAADQAVILREVARAVARRQGVAVSFAPIVAGMGVGNGVHVHLGLIDRDGRPAMHDPAGPGGLSRTAGSFVAGILRHLPALVAFTAASPVSYQRLVPHRWSAAFNNLGWRDREAAVQDLPGARERRRSPRSTTSSTARRMRSRALTWCSRCWCWPGARACARACRRRSRARAIWRCSTRPRSRRKACAACRPRSRQRSRRSTQDATVKRLAAAPAAGLLPQAQARRARGARRPLGGRAGRALRRGLLMDQPAVEIQRIYLKHAGLGEAGMVRF